MRGSKIHTSSVKNRIAPAMHGSKDKIRLVDLLRKEILSNDDTRQVCAIQYTQLDDGCFEFLQRQLATIHCGLDDTHESYYNSLRN